MLCDIRYMPHSRWLTDWNQGILAKRLGESYRHIEALGGVHSRKDKEQTRNSHNPVHLGTQHGQDVHSRDEEEHGLDHFARVGACGLPPWAIS